MAATEWERSETEPGSIILGRYRLLSPLASGAMGSVWRAQDLTLLRTVALKLLFVREDAAGRTMGERFLREARIAAGIRHRNVVDVLDFGTSEQGRPFMVMELLEGESLESRCERLPALTLHELITIVAGVLDGLTAVHKVGVVHRDLKPANILLVASEDSDPRPKLVDFGVAHAPERRSALTSVTGIVVGTPEYMSPEQARGVPVDARSDLYSVGAILYEALAGRLPYEQEALGDLIIAIASGGAPPVAEVRPEVGEAISAVVSRAMELRPEDRFQSAREMRDALLRAAGLAVPTSSVPIAPQASLQQRDAERSGVRAALRPSLVPTVAAPTPAPFEPPAPSVPSGWWKAGVAAVLSLGLAAMVWAVWRPATSLPRPAAIPPQSRSAPSAAVTPRVTPEPAPARLASPSEAPSATRAEPGAALAVSPNEASEPTSSMAAPAQPQRPTMRARRRPAVAAPVAPPVSPEPAERQDVFRELEY